MTVRKDQRVRQNRGVMFFRKIDLDVKRLFKSTAYRRGDSMRVVIEALMQAYIAAPHKFEQGIIVVKRRDKRRRGDDRTWVQDAADD